MDTQPLYHERQKFRQWWIWIILLVILGINVFGIVRQLILGEPFGDKPAGDAMLVMLAIFVLALNIFFWYISLLTKIDEKGIYIKFLPVHSKWRFYPWEEIASVEVKEYKPISEYGGWGIKPGAYNISGNKGMLIRFHKRSSLMIGTQNPEELKKVLKDMGKL